MILYQGGNVNYHAHHRRSSTDLLGVSAAMATAVAWGLTGIFVRSLEGLPALEIVGGRLLIAAIGITIFLVASHNLRNIRGRDLKSKFTWMLGAVLFIYFFGAVTAFQYAPISDVAILISMSPVFVVLRQVIFGNSLNQREVWGVLIALLGVTGIVLQGVVEVSSKWPLRFVGDGLALVASVATAVYAMLYRTAVEIKAAPSGANVTLISGIIGGALVLLLSISDNSDISLLQFHLYPLSALLALGLVSTMVPSLTYAVASARLPPLLTTTLRLTTPIFATIFAYIIFRETPSLWVIPGGGLVIYGSYLVATSKGQ
jgi:drug/metabolite transporter (DMT)-like permease